jgi:autotransporter-associated beta strand protein
VGGATNDPRVLTVGGNNTSTTFSGSLVDNVPTQFGGGASTLSMIKEGLGSLVLSGTNTYTGTTTVNGGVLQVDGSITSSSMTTVNASATLTGTGSVGNTQINSNGIFAAGHGAPGTSMTVNGSLAFQSGAIYAISLDPSTSSSATVTAVATLGGATVNATFANGSYISKQYTILNAASIGGTFGSVANTNLPSNFHDTLSYDATHAYLNLVLNFTSQPGPNYGGGLNINQQNVANALINFFNATGGIPIVFGTLTPAGLTQASGETATGSQQTTFDAMSQFMGLLTDPFMNRNGALANSPPSSGYADENAHAARSNPTDAFAMFAKAPPQIFQQRWSTWVAGYGGSQSTVGNNALGSNNTTSNIAATAVGADYLFSPNTIGGFAIAGGGTSFGVANGGTGRSDLFQFGAYVRHNAGPAYITAALAYGWQDITTNRTVTAAGSDRLRAEFNANAWSGRIEGGYRFVSPATFGVGITPYAAAQFVTFDLPSYAEQALVGATTFALAYSARDVTDPRAELGLRTDKSWAVNDGLLTLRGRVAWAHDYDPSRSIAATFQTLPGAAFVVNGAAQAADSALTTASAEMKWRNGWSAGATFEGEFSSVTNSYAGKGVVRYQW